MQFSSMFGSFFLGGGVGHTVVYKAYAISFLACRRLRRSF